jgi:hypothetical protein
VAAVAAACALAPAAQAGVLVAAAPSCEQGALEQPFARWLDPISYTLLPDGGLESGAAGWSLAGGAKVVDGNETFYVHGAGESKALLLPRAAPRRPPSRALASTSP